VPFVPLEVTLQEAGPNAPYRWLLEASLTWSGSFRRVTQDLNVPASPEHPFTTDLASVPRSLTWLFPRYGKYTKAAILHDYLCQNFHKTGDANPASDLPLRDRSDADEVFRNAMAELRVPFLRRVLMWTAVSWATLFTCLVPGRRSKAVQRWVGRVVVVLGVAALVVELVLRHDRPMVVGVGLLVPLVVLAGATIALGRWDRVPAYAAAYGLTIVFSPLLAIGAGLGLVLFLYFFLEDVSSGLPKTRGLFVDLFSRRAKQEKLATPQFARIAAVYLS